VHSSMVLAGHKLTRLAAAAGGEHVHFMDAAEGEESAWVEMEAVRGCAVGGEVYNTYGVLGNAALLSFYGFTHDHNPADTVSLSGALVRAVCALEGAQPPPRPRAPPPPPHVMRE